MAPKPVWSYVLLLVMVSAAFSMPPLWESNEITASFDTKGSTPEEDMKAQGSTERDNWDGIFSRGAASTTHATSPPDERTHGGGPTPPHYPHSGDPTQSSYGPQPNIKASAHAHFNAGGHGFGHGGRFSQLFPDPIQILMPLIKELCSIVGSCRPSLHPGGGCHFDVLPHNYIPVAHPLHPPPYWARSNLRTDSTKDDKYEDNQAKHQYPHFFRSFSGDGDAPETGEDQTQGFSRSKRSTGFPYYPYYVPEYFENPFYWDSYKGDYTSPEFYEDMENDECNRNCDEKYPGSRNSAGRESQAQATEDSTEEMSSDLKDDKINNSTAGGDTANDGPGSANESTEKKSTASGHRKRRSIGFGVNPFYLYSRLGHQYHKHGGKYGGYGGYGGYGLGYGGYGLGGYGGHGGYGGYGGYGHGYGGY